MGTNIRIPKHPGKLLKEELEARALSANAFAQAIDVPANRISEIVRERRNVTADTALRLASYFGGSPEFWLNLQTNHDLGVAKNNLHPDALRKIKSAA